MRKIRLVRAFDRCLLLIPVARWTCVWILAPDTAEGFERMRDQVTAWFHDRNSPIGTYELAVSLKLINWAAERPLAEVMDV